MMRKAIEVESKLMDRIFYSKEALILGGSDKIWRLDYLLLIAVWYAVGRPTWHQIEKRG